ncbi:general substrate transporter [Gloeopeniophorella convolvens]|nr:general substrate transporter [Gloeopeniophorella convolvens]
MPQASSGFRYAHHRFLQKDYARKMEKSEKLEDAVLTSEKADITDEHVEIENLQYADVVDKGRIDPFTWSSFVIYACAGVACLCACVNGYDGSLMTAINGMPFYQDQFDQGHLGVSTGLIFSMYTVGQMVGAIFAGPICDKFGRRAGMFIGAVIIMAGSAIISSSEHKPQFVGGRFALGFGIAMATTAAPMFIVECAPPQWRGRLTAFYNTGWFVGSIPAAGITLGCSHLQSNWSWRIPLILQAFPAAIVVCTVWFLPESPRWLMAQGRTEAAFTFLTKYHGNGDANHPIVQLEMREFAESIRTDGSDKVLWDFRAVIANRNVRWRFLMVFSMGFFGQMAGNGLGYFNLSIYQSLGFGTSMQFNMNLISTCTCACTSWIMVSLTGHPYLSQMSIHVLTSYLDRLPRRKVIVIGSSLVTLMLALNAGLSAKWASYGDGPKNLAVGNAAVAFYFLFNVAYSSTYTPLQALYPAECLETTTRAKGLALGSFVVGCTSFINLFCTPIAFGKMGWKFILVFVGWDTFETVMWYFLCVETHGRTLEELDEIFSSPNPVATSKRKRQMTNSAVRG